MTRLIAKNFENQGSSVGIEIKSCLSGSEFFLSVAVGAVAFFKFLASVLIFASLHQGKEDRNYDSLSD